MGPTLRATLLGLTAAVLLCAACTSAKTSATHRSSTRSIPATASASATQACNVTTLTAAGVPATVHEQTEGPVFGRGALWVDAWWADPQSLAFVRSGELGDAQHRFGEKYATYTLRGGEVTDSLGPPRVRVAQLDGRGDGSTIAGGYATAAKDGSNQLIHWWPTGVSFAGRGCWRITETVADASISYVVRI